MESSRETQQTQTITANVLGLLALRQHRLDRAVGIRRVTPRVALLLDCYRIHRQQEVAALSPLEWLGYTIRETRLEVAALNQVAQASTDVREVAGILARVEALTGYVQFLSEQLEGVAGG